MIQTSLQGAHSPLWALTSFYNPEGYKRRVMNFQLFRSSLGIPLVVVELSWDGQYQIDLDAADVVIRLPGSAVLWQKERLLNVALSHVPPHVENIAWLDGDILFNNPNWSVEAVRLLDEYPLIQLFSELFDLDPDESVSDVDIHNDAPSGSGIAWLVQSQTLKQEHFSPKSTSHMRHGAFGLAWAARRSLLEAHGFYDAMILGSGDRAMACAAFGRFGDAIAACHLNERRTAHYMDWAQKYHEAVCGKVGYLPGAIYHLWHGDLVNRGYKERHIALAGLDFDPYLDIRVDENGAWEWARHRPEIEELIHSYFKSRREDGV